MEREKGTEGMKLEIYIDANIKMGMLGHNFSKEVMCSQNNERMQTWKILRQNLPYTKEKVNKLWSQQTTEQQEPGHVSSNKEFEFKAHDKGYRRLLWYLCGEGSVGQQTWSYYSLTTE